MRHTCFDVLKAIAIIAVVLYHFGICEYGYLGVDIFLVVAGYFTSQSIDRNVNKQKYKAFVINRLFRLLPLLLIADVVCLGYGWLMMLPDDFENVAQSVVATNFFGNNILQAITTKNYWDVVNDYKPLMHTWYVGLIMQFYIIIPLLLYAVGKWVKDANKRKIVNITMVCVIGIISLIMYLMEKDSAAKFYYLPYRLYEFCAGSLMFYLFGKKPEKDSKNIWMNFAFVMAYLGVIMLLFLDAEYASRPIKQLSIVGLTSVLMVMMLRVELAQDKIFSNKCIATIGAASLSIFVWHQVILALIRYSFTNKLTDTSPLLTFASITAILSIFSYKYVEHMKKTKITWMLIGLLFVLTTGTSIYIYKNAGVVRDVPELDVIKGNAHKGMWAEYCDRVKLYDKDFSSSDKPKWYVFGNSFGRDFVNIILESPVADIVEIVYSETLEQREHRLKEADVVFISTKGINENLIEKVRSMLDIHTKLYIVGEKNFGENNGQVYRHRFESNYHQLTVEMENGYAEKNEKLRNAYSDIYIDMIALVQKADGRMPVFTEDGKFISQDCRHLTKAGAYYYMKLMNWDRFLERK